MSRKVVKNIESIEQDEGLGARVRRSIGGREVKISFRFMKINFISSY